MRVAESLVYQGLVAEGCSEPRDVSVGVPSVQPPVPVLCVQKVDDLVVSPEV